MDTYMMNTLAKLKLGKYTHYLLHTCFSTITAIISDTLSDNFVSELDYCYYWTKNRAVFFLFSPVRKLHSCTRLPIYGLTITSTPLGFAWHSHHHVNLIEVSTRWQASLTSKVNQNNDWLETHFGNQPSKNFQNLPSQNLCCMEFLIQTAAVFVSLFFWS